MQIRKNTKAYKSILQIVEDCQSRPDRERLIRLYITRAGHTLEQRISVEGIEGDADLASLRSDARYAAVVERAKRNARPCDHDPNYRKFDFWVGDWNVTVSGQQAGTNRIELIEGNCVVFENWTGAGGSTGKSFNFYNRQTGKWNQVWVASNGSNLFFEGEFREGNLHYTGTTLGAGGAKTLHKLTFFNLGPGHVRQFWESSTDDGKTWTVAFDGDYRLKK